MTESRVASEITSPLRAWFQRRQRRLPWRDAPSPYGIWISEIMLQQTQVKTVVPYYERFMARFPDAHSLADASEEAVLELWAGLGYYSRGRNLHRAARSIVRDHGGEFPSRAKEIRALPGIGDYTTAAIGSIAFGHPLAAIDGNVERVLCRYLGLDGDPRRGETRRQLHEAARIALDPADPGTHNQALMELGALVCRPRDPLCDQCPLAGSCRSFEEGTTNLRPRPRRRREVEEQHWMCAVVESRDGVLLHQQPPDAELLRGHWGPPLKRCPGTVAPESGWLEHAARDLARATFRVSFRNGRLAPVVRHGITYRRLLIHPVHLSHRGSRGQFRVCRWKDAATLAALFRKVLTNRQADASTHERPTL